MEAEMPWFPDFAIGVEPARRKTREVIHADPVTQYFRAQNDGSWRSTVVRRLWTTTSPVLGSE
jgi:hypothetical protein